MEKEPKPTDDHRTQPDAAVSYPTIGSYRLLNLLGEGGMGRVYLAQHLVSGTPVALKVIRPELLINRSTVRRFIAEARTVSRIGHRNIVRVLDAGEPSPVDGHLYYAMEYLTGIDLRRELQAGSLLLPRVVSLGVQICDGLQAVHDAGVIHRDLKSANIFLIREQDGQELAKLLDFGLAKLEYGDAGVNTTTGHLFGTPAYMSPEQVGGRKVSKQSDLYSVGVILYEMLTGRLPFEGQSFGDYAVQHLTTTPFPPSAFSPPGAPLSADVDFVVLRCLEKRPDKRYATAGELADALQSLVPRKTLPPSLMVRAARPRRRRQGARTVRTIAMSAAGGLVAVGIYALMGSSPPPVSPSSTVPAAVSPPASAPSRPVEPPPSTGAPGVDAGPTESPAILGSPVPSRARKQAKAREASKQTERARGSLDHLTMDPF